MIREERDPAFWRWVAEHPAVREHVGDFNVAAVVTSAAVTPLASAHGGYLFHRLTPTGLAVDLHAMFRPEGWGRETTGALKAALVRVFADGAELVTVQEVAGWWRSRPPRSFGFEPTGPARETPSGPFRLWTLSRARWEQSPAFKRMRRCPPH